MKVVLLAFQEVLDGLVVLSKVFLNMAHGGLLQKLDLVLLRVVQYLMIQIIIYHDPRDLSDFSIDIDICPECEEVNDIENEQIEKL